MNGTFVPLSVKRPADEFLAAPVPSQEKSVAPAAPPVAQTNGAPCNLTPKREPQVELIRDGGRVSHLKITCACGEVITIECQF